MRNKQKVFGKSDNVTWKNSGPDRSILLDLKSGNYFTLNETATVIWKHALNGASLSSIQNRIFEDFGVEQDIADGDVEDLVGTLISKGLMTEKETTTNEQEDKKLEDISSSGLYIKPQIQEHGPIQTVTAGSATTYGGSGSHYWYPN